MEAKYAERTFPFLSVPAADITIVFVEDSSLGMWQSCSMNGSSGVAVELQYKVKRDLKFHSSMLTYAGVDALVIPRLEMESTT